MEKNSEIVEILLNKLSNNEIRYTKAYNEFLKKLITSYDNFVSLIQSDERLSKMFSEYESASNDCQSESEEIYFSEGVRLGFKLCMDIFEN